MPRAFSQVVGLNTFMHVIAGSFSIAASGGAATKVFGLGWSVAKTATGVYTITFEEAYVNQIAACATVQAATAVDLVAQIKSVDVVSAQTLVVELLAAATPTEPAAVTVVNFLIYVQTSTVGQ